MTDNVYARLARHLDDLPGGFPVTESGVETRILRRLFTPQEAALAVHLSLLAEEPRVIARRAKMPVAELADQLEEMAHKGLIYRTQKEGSEPRYMAAQFVIGIWEYQVNRLEPDLIRDFEEYLPTLAAADAWGRVPQLRTIPVAESIDSRQTVLAYERAEELVRAQTRFAVAPCICRKEQRMLGEGCDKPLETCLTFGMAADYYVHTGKGRAISQQEALELLVLANEAGLVLQPGNAKEPLNICACCGCCCGVLRAAKHHPQPASLFITPFLVVVNPDACEGCGLCTTRCQMEALELADAGIIEIDADRCIGCGLCVTTCPTGALSLMRKPEGEQRPVPKDIVSATIQLGQARGKMRPADLVKMVVRSKVDRALASRRSE